MIASGLSVSISFSEWYLRHSVRSVGSVSIILEGAEGGLEVGTEGEQWSRAGSDGAAVREG